MYGITTRRKTVPTAKVIAPQGHRILLMGVAGHLSSLASSSVMP